METTNPAWNTALWRQFGAALDTLGNALEACPDALWRERLWSSPDDQSRYSLGEFWFVSFHTLNWLDLILSSVVAPAVEVIAPPPPFPTPAHSESDNSPQQPYTKEQMRAYLAYTRRKCRDALTTLNSERASYVYEFPWEQGQGRSTTYLELMLYTMRHTQEHAAHLSLFLGQHGIPDAALDWVMRADDDA